jgi:hypothetical protein
MYKEKMGKIAKTIRPDLKGCNKHGESPTKAVKPSLRPEREGSQVASDGSIYAKPGFPK